MIKEGLNVNLTRRRGN